MIFDPYAAELLYDPYPIYKSLRQAGSVIPMANTADWVITRYSEIEFALKNPKIFSSSSWDETRQIVPELRENIPEISMIAEDPPKHTRKRRIVGKAFGKKSIHSFQPLVERIAKKLADELPLNTPYDVMASFNIPLPLHVISAMLGVDEGLAQSFRDWSNDIIDTRTVVFMPEGARKRQRLNEVIESNHAMSTYLGSLIEKKRAEPDDDLISLMVQGNDQGSSLTDHEIISMAVLLLVAGNETTTNLLGNTMRALSEHPRIRNDILEGKVSAEDVLEESVRYDAPAQSIPRTLLQDCELGGVHMKKGQRVLLLLGSAGRDELVYDQPDEFNPYRKNKEHLSFGAGVHTCLGIHLARLEAKIGLEVFLSKSPHFTVGDGTFVETNFLRGNQTLTLYPDGWIPSSVDSNSNYVQT